MLNEDGRDEIINDIESRISELFQERLKKGSTCITDDDVNAIIKNMGRPQDLEDAEVGNNKPRQRRQRKYFCRQTEIIIQDSWSWKRQKGFIAMKTIRYWAACVVVLQHISESIR